MEDETNLAADDTQALLDSVSETPDLSSDAEATEEKPAPKMFKLKRGGEEFEKEETEVLSLAQKGLDYEINNRLLRQERELLELQKKDYADLDPNRFQELRKIDEFARQNPDWLELIKAEYEKRQTTPTEVSDDPIMQKLSSLERAVGEIKTREDQLRSEREDQELDRQIKSWRDSTPEIDWNHKDEFGFTVEHKVLKHLSDGNFPSFRAAFLDLYGDEWANKKAEGAVSKKLEELKANQKKGLIMNRAFSLKDTIQTKKSLKDTSYDELTKLSLKELGITGG